MIHRIIPTPIPQDKREEINTKILFGIDACLPELTPEVVYNTYTGLGGLHKLHKSDYANQHEYTQAKQEFELGQFFTPHTVCTRMVGLLAPTPEETVMEMCCGMGNFFNWLPNRNNAYGFDIDPDAIKVARYLYPESNFQVGDIQDYDPKLRFDIIIGNPPFNLDFKGELSQLYYLRRAYEFLNPGGLLMCVVPETFLSNEFWEKSRIKFIDRDFSFIGQARLDPNAFRELGVENFGTKVMVFMRGARCIDSTAYKAAEFCTWGGLGERIAGARELKKKLRLKLMQETTEINMGEEKAFQYTIDKYLYELKTHKALHKHHDKAVALVAKFRNQRPPENPTKAQRDEYEKSKLTYAKVLAVVRRYIREQNYVPRKEVALVRTQYGFKLKGYAPGLLNKVKHTEAKLYDLVLGRTHLPLYNGSTEKLQKQYAAARKVINRKQRQFERQNRPFYDMEQDPALAQYIDRTSFLNPAGEICRFTPLQKHDMNLMFQKDYGLLNWQQGSGKTAVAYHYARYQMVSKTVRNTVVLAPAIAIHLTWAPFLARMGRPYVVASRPEHIQNAPEGAFVIVSLSMIGALKRDLMRFMKLRSRKICLIFDESDEITNPLAIRTRTSLAIFRRAKRKILTTGTTTRNNIVELYPQIEMLYNNSVNMPCECDTIYFQDRESGTITESENSYFGRPFPPFGGWRLFRACHCPAKATVFGIEKQNQDIYNKDQLWDLIGKSIITRKFKEFAGDKYQVVTHTVPMHDGEKEVYRVILKEFMRICDQHFKKIKDSKKEAGLRMIRQINLLIKACSVPHHIEGYFGDRYPSKVHFIGDMVARMQEKVCIGGTTHDATDMYAEYMAERFPERPLFVISGKVDFPKRQRIIKQFEATEDGILVCTQQSLKSSVNIPTCNEVILEAMQWNIPKMEQFYFRFIRLDSKHSTNVNFVSYAESIEQNLLALVLTKERLNEFIKSGEIKAQSAIFEEFGTEMSLIESLMQKSYDDKGNMTLSWGQQKAS